MHEVFPKLEMQRYISATVLRNYPSWPETSKNAGDLQLNSLLPLRPIAMLQITITINGSDYGY